jgi:hypothetical protein
MMPAGAAANRDQFDQAAPQGMRNDRLIEPPLHVQIEGTDFDRTGRPAASTRPKPVTPRK